LISAQTYLKFIFIKSKQFFRRLKHFKAVKRFHRHPPHSENIYISRIASFTFFYLRYETLM
jgi:hypothetical protein